MAFMHDDAFDGLLEEIRGADTLHICSASPGTYTAATSTLSLGKAIPSACAIVAGSEGGREFTVEEITTGSVTASGSARYFALVDDTVASERLLLWQLLGASAVVTCGNDFILNQWKVCVPKPA